MRMLFAILAAAGALAQSSNPRLEGQQAYLFAYPLVLMDATMRASGGVNPNRFIHSAAFPDPKFRTIVRPNADTLYSSGWVDLSKEPVLLRAPDTKGRYYLVQVLDAWTETIAVPGKRTTGTGEKWFAITGPGWTGKLPANVDRIECATNLAWILGRTQTNGTADYASVHAVQRGFRLMPLSRYPDGSRIEAGKPAVARPGPPPPAEVAELGDVEFFNRFLQLLAANPGHAADAPFLQKLAELGLKPGQTITALPSKDFEDGVKSAKALLASVDQLRTTMAGKNGWTGVNSNVGRYGVNYMARAVVARVGLGANPPEDAVYLNCYRDPMGKALDSARSYRMHLEKNELPPVKAFWSITMYDPHGYFAENPIGRYAIGDRDALQYNADGSLDLYVQREAPSPAQKSNWLPTPSSGNFNLTFRLYWPHEEILEGKWTPPPVLAAGAQ